MAQLTLPAKLKNLEVMLEFIRNKAKELGFDNRKLNQIQIAAEEALVNIINYAYSDEVGKVEIECCIEDGKRLLIKITDWGMAFDPLSLPEPDTEASIEERKIGGLGVFMMRKFMDEISYKREKERNVLTLLKS